MSPTPHSPPWTRIFSAVLLLVFILISTGSVFAQSSSKPTGNGPFFIYPPGVTWKLGSGQVYHTSCNNENDPACEKIKAWDYVLAANTPMYLPFPGGTVVMSCQKYASEYDSLFKTPDERILVVRSDDGRWEIGSLHVSPKDCLPEGAHVGRMEIWGYVGNEGNSTTAHNHLWFRDLQQGRNVCDHDWFWKGGAFGLLGNSQPNIDCAQSIDIPTPTALYSKTYNLSRHAGGIASTNPDGTYNYKWPNYAYNMRQFFYFVDHGVPGEQRTATGQYDHDDKLVNFSGSYTFTANQEYWVNDIAGPYGPDEGMREAEVGGIRQGGGACNTTSMMAEVLASTQVCTISNTVRHSTDIPEIEFPALHSLAVGTSGRFISTDSDAKIVCSQDVTLRWDLAGDTITLTAFNGTLTVLSNPGSTAFNPPTQYNPATTMVSSQPVAGAPLLTIDYVPGTVLFSVPLEAVVESTTKDPLPSAFDFGKYYHIGPDGTSTINVKGIFGEFGWFLLALVCFTIVGLAIFKPQIQRS